MEQFWQQDRLLLSVELFGMVLVLCAVVALAVSVSRHVQAPSSRLNDKLRSPRGILAFKAARIALGSIGIAVIVATLLPGLLPFKDHVDTSLGLGGIALFFVWPLIAVQIVMGFSPLEKKFDSTYAWGLLIIAYVIGLQICVSALRLLYN